MVSPCPAHHRCQRPTSSQIQSARCKTRRAPDRVPRLGSWFLRERVHCKRCQTSKGPYKAGNKIQKGSDTLVIFTTGSKPSPEKTRDPPPPKPRESISAPAPPPPPLASLRLPSKVLSTESLTLCRCASACSLFWTYSFQSSRPQNAPRPQTHPKKTKNKTRRGRNGAGLEAARKKCRRRKKPR